MDNGHQFVGDILKKDFNIPSYQRGYRWTEENVTKLLEDIFEDRLCTKVTTLNDNNAYKQFWHISFNEDGEGNYIIPKNKYCIQPLVITQSPQNTTYDIIDGQQRLTTIAIIRASLKFTGNIDTIKVPKITYETRNSSNYINSFYTGEFEEKSESDIDFSYMKQAFNVAKGFFDKELEKLKDFTPEIQKKYCDYLDDVICKNTQFIWYCVESDDPQKVFGNFNSGKLELTNSELIKALFMNPASYDNDNIKDKQIVISEKWDEIENKLHEDDFWAFVPHPKQYESKDENYNTRIDVIFDFLVMEIWIENNKPESNEIIEKYINYRNEHLSDKYIFNEIEAWINKSLDCRGDKSKETVMNECWRRVGKIFSGLKELYSDNNRIYNIVGLYINILNRNPNTVDSYTQDNETYLKVYYNLNQVLSEPRNKREDGFKHLIRTLVFKEMTVENKIKKTKYDEGKSFEIVRMLIIYNIAVINTSQGTGERFNFLANAKNKWQREHIFATDTNDTINNQAMRKSALEVLESDCYIKYVQYLYDLNDTTEINFTPKKEKEQQFTLENADETTLQKFINANSSSKKAGQNAMLARALRTKRNSKIINECYENIEKLSQFKALGNTDKDVDKDVYEKLVYKYLNTELGSKFYNLENLDIRLFDGFENTIMGADNKTISFDEIGFDYDLEDFDEHKTGWKNWLAFGKALTEDNENDEDDEDENENKNQKTNLDDLRDQIAKAFSNHIRNKFYTKKLNDNDDDSSYSLKQQEDIMLDDINIILELHEKTLNHRIERFFKDNFPKLLNDNSMGNMTLLTGGKDSTGQNQTVSNKSYSEKKTIVFNEFYKKGEFVPLGTLLVFTDAYNESDSVSNYWLPDSRFKYLKDMINTISNFLEKKECN